MLPLNLVKILIKEIGIQNRVEFEKWVMSNNLQSHIPLDPSTCYSSWKSWSDVFGKIDPVEFEKYYRELLKDRLLMAKDHLKKRKPGAPYQL